MSNFCAEKQEKIDIALIRSFLVKCLKIKWYHYTRTSQATAPEAMWKWSRSHVIYRPWDGSERVGLPPPPRNEGRAVNQDNRSTKRSDATAAAVVGCTGCALWRQDRFSFLPSTQVWFAVPIRARARAPRVEVTALTCAVCLLLLHRWFYFLPHPGFLRDTKRSVALLRYRRDRLLRHRQYCREKKHPSGAVACGLVPPARRERRPLVALL